jgi:hypothetical protein
MHVELVRKKQPECQSHWHEGCRVEVLGAIGTGGLVLPVIPAEYTWMLGATGMSQALTIVAGAMGVRFLLQTVPFVRWGS